jgi:SAM-dependent methyltransferase
LGRNIPTERNYRELAELVLSATPLARVLVIGGSIAGDGIHILFNQSRLELVETDVTFGPRTQIICDGHSIPFADGSFDAVVIQGVLQCLVDPDKCVGEIHRVLKEGGIVYAEAPFVQQVVDAPYDFNRFTRFGLSRLFRQFEQVNIGVVRGPGTVVAWSIQFFLLSFFQSSSLRGLVRITCSLSLSWLKYFDFYLVRRTAAFDSAAGLFFMGRKAPSVVLDDRVLVEACAKVDA